MDGMQGSLADGRCGIDRRQKDLNHGGSWAAERETQEPNM